MAFSSWRTRSRVIESISPICSKVSLVPERPKRREMISFSRSCSIMFRLPFIAFAIISAFWSIMFSFISTPVDNI